MEKSSNSETNVCKLYKQYVRFGNRVQDLRHSSRIAPTASPRQLNECIPDYTVPGIVHSRTEFQSVLYLLFDDLRFVCEDLFHLLRFGLVFVQTLLARPAFWSDLLQLYLFLVYLFLYNRKQFQSVFTTYRTNADFSTNVWYYSLTDHQSEVQTFKLSSFISECETGGLKCLSTTIGCHSVAHYFWASANSDKKKEFCMILFLSDNC